MDTVGLREFKDHLSALVDEVATLHARLVITRHGEPAAVLIAVEDLESMEETIELLSTPGLLKEMGMSDRKAAAGEGVSLEDYQAGIEQRLTDSDALVAEDSDEEVVFVEQDPVISPAGSRRIRGRGPRRTEDAGLKR